MTLPTNGTMLSRPGDPAYFAGLLDCVEPPDIFEGIPAAEPIDGWGPEEQWRDLVGKIVPDIAPVPPRPIYTGPAGMKVERIGPTSWRIEIGIGTFIFRDVVTHRGMEADVTVLAGDLRLLRTTATLSLTGRKTLARGAIERAIGYGTEAEWHRAVDLACEAVMDASEALGDGTDLRRGTLESQGPEWVCEPLWSTGATMLVMPGEAGKSTLARAMAVSISSGRMVVPGLYPRVTGPVLYIASEDPGPQNHLRSIEAICEGAGISRTNLTHEIRLVPSKGIPLHRMARTIAERSRDYAGVVLDAMQGLLPGGESGVRDQAAMFWGAIDELDRPTFVIAHPNLSQARGWKEADGRAAGSEVNRDRARMAWMGRSTDEPSEGHTYHRSFIMECTKRNDGPRPADFSFRRTWAPGVVTFSPYESPPIREGTLADAIASMLQEHPYRAREIGERLGQSQQTVNTTCGRKPEAFFRTPEGDWSLVGWSLDKTGVL